MQTVIKKRMQKYDNYGKSKQKNADFTRQTKTLLTNFAKAQYKKINDKEFLWNT